MIPLSTRSINVFTLLYLNLPPNLLISTFLAYSFNEDIISVLSDPLLMQFVMDYNILLNLFPHIVFLSQLFQNLYQR
ncbi:MAG: hypothetical protein CM15mP113_3050 [Pseudomonadota bacterium]|nr:MAG: hypothetical protein CM15mP113_3050 [Pseudomonadota bacterium]